MRTWTVDDVMTRPVISVEPAAPYRSLVDVLVQQRLSAVPVVDGSRRVIGVVSEADLLRKIEYAGDEEPRIFDRRRRRGERRKAAGRTAADLMSAPPIVAALGTSIAAAARRMDHAAVKRLPIVDHDGRLVGIVSRTDLLKVHLRADEDILADVKNNVLRPFLPEDAATVTATVTNGAVALSGRVDRWSSAEIAERLTRQVPGVTEVTSTLAHAFDDRTARDRRSVAGSALASADTLMLPSR
jgi:CBS domain-containing protein